MGVMRVLVALGDKPIIHDDEVVVRSGAQPLRESHYRATIDSYS